MTVYDRLDLASRVERTLLRALGEEVAVVALVILVFLLHLRSAAIPLVTLPVVLLITFAAMRLLDVPATIMSFAGIGIALGLAVDADVVALEACHRRLEVLPPDASPAQRQGAILAASGFFAPAILTSLGITAVSFLPVFGFTGETGRLLRPLVATKTVDRGGGRAGGVDAGPGAARRRPPRPREAGARQSRHPPAGARLPAVRAFRAVVAGRDPRDRAAGGPLAACPSSRASAASSSRASTRGSPVHADHAAGRVAGAGRARAAQARPGHRRLQGGGDRVRQGGPRRHRHRSRPVLDGRDDGAAAASRAMAQARPDAVVQRLGARAAAARALPRVAGGDATDDGRAGGDAGSGDAPARLDQRLDRAGEGPHGHDGDGRPNAGGDPDRRRRTGAAGRRRAGGARGDPGRARDRKRRPRIPRW